MIDSLEVRTDAAEELIWMTAGKYALFMSHGKVGIDAMALYQHYQFTAILQKTNSVWASDRYCRQGLDWGRDRFEKAKALLIDLDIIKINQRKDEKGKFSKIYVTVKRGKAQLEPSDLSDRLPENPQAGKPACGKTAPNALSNNINALTKKRKGAVPENNDFNQTCNKSVTLRNAEKQSNEPTEHQRIKEYFQHHNPEYYHTGKEAKLIKSIQSRCNGGGFDKFKQVADKLLALNKSGDRWWGEQPFNPQTVFSQWERILKAKVGKATAGKSSLEEMQERGII